MKQGAAPSERSIVTVLSADIVGSTQHIADCEPDDAQSFFDQCFERLRQAIESAGGLLVSYAGDGGIAVFGWPSALEDHADQGCIAAWRIQHPAEALLGPAGQPVMFRVGVHSGLVGVRRLNRAGRSALDTVGAAVNYAAKLQQVAPPGGIVVSAATVDLCRSRLEIAPAPAVMDGPQARAHLLKGPPDRTSYSGAARRYSTPFVGRRSELDLLQGAIRRQEGAPRSVALIGEPGIGKSRLAHAAFAEAMGAGSQALAFYGDAQQRTTPFAAAVAFLAALLRLPEAASAERLADALRPVELDEAETQAIATLFAHGRRGGGQSTQTQIARALVQVFFKLAGGKPALLLLEDLHLVDPESQLFLRLLVQDEAAQVLSLIVTGRPEAFHDAREIVDAVIPLDPLPREEMRSLAGDLWPSGASRDLLERAVDRADGVPFVLEEFARSMGAPDAAGALPHSVESVIHARLRRLSRGAKAVAEALSLLGQEVEIGLLKAVTGKKTDALLADLSELERFAFLHPIDGRRTHFRHQIIAEACANTIPRERRVKLHRAALAAMSGRKDSPAGRYAQLAFHAEGAGDDRAALGYLREAGIEARGTSAAASLNLIFDRALVLIERIGPDAEKTYVDFVLMAFPSMLLLGEFDKMRAHLPKVMALARRHEQPDKVSNSLSQLGMLCWFEGRYEEGVRATREGLEIARRIGSPALAYSNQIMLANALHGMGRIDEALGELAEIRELLTGDLATKRWGAPSIPRSTALSFTCWIMVEAGRYAEAMAFGERGLEIALSAGDPYSEVMARNAIGRNLLLQGRNDEAVACLAVAMELAERNGYDATKANLTGHMAAALARLGRAAEAIEMAQACLAAQLHLRTGRMENYLLKAGYGEALARAGETGRGLATLDEALEIARSVDNPCLLASGLGLRARLLAELAPGDPRIPRDLREEAQLCRTYGLVTACEAAPA